MKEQFDDFQKFIEEEFNREGKEIERKVKENPDVAGLKADDELKEKLDRKIEAYEEERRRELISMLSEEDREALALGREVKEKEAREEKSRAAKKRKRIWKRLGAAAAVVALVLTVGITGVGGPKRLVEVMRQAVGSREMTQIESDDDGTLKSGEDEEEKAYQLIKEKFGINPVRLIRPSNEIHYKHIEIDENLQTAQILYDNNGKVFTYIISCSYADDSLGITMDDLLEGCYDYTTSKTTIEVKVYEIKETHEKKYCAQFEYQNIYYYLVTTMEKTKFEEILNILHFS